MLKNKK